MDNALTLSIFIGYEKHVFGGGGSLSSKILLKTHLVFCSSFNILLHASQARDFDLII